MSVLVTGAAGLIGSAVVEALDGRARAVLASDVRPFDAPARVESAVLDVTDTSAVEVLFGGRRFDAVIHCGGISGPMVAPGEPAVVARVNIDGTLNLLDSLRRAGRGRFILASSCAAYGGDGDELLDETAPFTPDDVYGASKAAADLLVRSYSLQHSVEAVALRLSWVYGPRRTTDCVIRMMLADALAGRETILDLDAGHARQFVHVDDAVGAILAALDAPRLERRAFNVTGGDRTTMKALAALVREILPSSRVTFGTAHVPRQPEFTIDAITAAVGWRPRISLHDGVRTFLDSITEGTRAR